VTFDMPESYADWIAECHGITDHSVYVVVIIGGVIRPIDGVVHHGVYVRDNSLIIAEALELWCMVLVWSVALNVVLYKYESC